jgi:hypothetical protein
MIWSNFNDTLNDVFHPCDNLFCCFFDLDQSKKRMIHNWSLNLEISLKGISTSKIQSNLLVGHIFSGSNLSQSGIHQFPDFTMIIWFWNSSTERSLEKTKKQLNFQGVI